MKKVLSLILVLVMALTALGTVFASADALEDDLAMLRPTMKAGASIRLASDSGIRFQTVIPKALLDNAKELVISENILSYSFGTVIARAADVEEVGTFTAEAMTAAGKQIIDKKADKGINTVGDDLVISVAMINMENHYATRFAAVGYVEYVKADSTTFRVYAVYNPANARSIEEVAYAALADVSDTKDATATDGRIYDTEVASYYKKTSGYWKVIDEAAYSLYGEKQLEIIRKYLLLPDLLDFAIKDNGTAVNAVKDGIAITSYDNADKPKTFVTDPLTNRPAVGFYGNFSKNYPSVFDYPTKTIHSTLSDGFSLSVTFCATEIFNLGGATYVGLVDFEEAGGFGLNFYKKGESTTQMTLKAEFAYGSTWTDIPYDIDLNKWYNVVIVYNGTDSFSLYVNGALVKTETFSGAFRLPTLSGRTDEQYICIGGDEMAWTDSKRSCGVQGFAGYISACGLYSEPLTANEVKQVCARDFTAPEAREADVLDLVIREDKTVFNAAEGMPIVTYNEYAANKATVHFNETIGRDSIVFAGGASTPSTYTLPASTLNSTLTDGFAVECYFMATGTFDSTYVGLVDYEEGGGFGLDLYSISGDSTHLKLSADLARDTSGWESIPYNVELNKWYHVVIVFNGSNAFSLYVNGALVETKTVSAAMRLPSFSSGAGTEYICVGGCAQAYNTIAGGRSAGMYGFIGEIADCNIYSTPKTATEVADLYTAATATAAK